MDPYRLPRTVVPSRYDLRLEPDLANARVAGEVTISVSVRERVREVFLNAIELEVHDASFEEAGGARLKATVGLDEKTERCRLGFEGPLGVGEGRLRLRFAGTLNDKL